MPSKSPGSWRKVCVWGGSHLDTGGDCLPGHGLSAQAALLKSAAQSLPITPLSSHSGCLAYKNVTICRLISRLLSRKIFIHWSSDSFSILICKQVKAGLFCSLDLEALKSHTSLDLIDMMVQCSALQPHTSGSSLWVNTMAPCVEFACLPWVTVGCPPVSPYSPRTCYCEIELQNYL